MGNAQGMCFCAQMALSPETKTSEQVKPMAIVLGAAVWAGGVPSPTLRRRAAHAAGLWHCGDVSGIVASGGVGKNPPSEAQAIVDICQGLGVAATDLILEDQSHTTEENLLFSSRKLHERGARSAIIVTDTYHAPRALLVARRVGLQARASCPAQRGTSLYRLGKSWLREIPAFLWYLVTGKGRSQ